MKLAYYAHCQAIYGTPQERRDQDLIRAMGFDFIDVAAADVQVQCAHAKSNGLNVMDFVFKPLVRKSDLLVFRALPDGRIPAGVCGEIQFAKEFGIPIIELPSGISSRMMSIEETREFLAEIGQR